MATQPPDIGVLEAIRPGGAIGAAQLAYPNLAALVSFHEPFQAEREARLRAAPAGTLEHMSALAAVRRFRLIVTALRLQTAEPSDRQRLSDEYTRLSLSIFGGPDRSAASRLLADELAALRNLNEEPQASQTLRKQLVTLYENQLGDNATVPDKPLALPLDAIVAATRAYFLDEYGGALHAVVGHDDLATVVDAKEVAARFREGLAYLQKTEPAWKAWKIEVGTGAALEVKVSKRTIVVGARRVPMNLRSVQSLFGHEVLVHALRSLRAEQRGDALGASGLPGYGDIEEGLGCLVEYAIGGNDDVLHKIRDRYLDVALALGMFAQPPLPRWQLFDVVSARYQLRDNANNISVVEKRAWAHVDRIYRGSLGTDIVGVCTKDSAYYKGFRSIVEYIAEARKTSEVAEIFGYLLAAKFNPLEPRHRAYMQAQSIVLRKTS